MGAAIRQSKTRKPQAKTQTPSKSKPAARQPIKQSTGTKKSACIELLRRRDGATIADLANATGWQPHSVRGFLSGTAKKLVDAELQTEARPGQPRRYRLSTRRKSRG